MDEPTCALLVSMRVVWAPGDLGHKGICNVGIYIGLIYEYDSRD